MSEVVLDASALLAYAIEEHGAEVVDEVLSQSVIATVNLTEVVSRLLDLGTAYRDVKASLASLPITVETFDHELALSAGALRDPTRHLGLSLGDRACLALAGKLGVPALTADRRWSGLDIGVEIRQIRG